MIVALLFAPLRYIFACLAASLCLCIHNSRHGYYANQFPNRMFCEPDAVDSKANIKADPTAPARSAIRRRRTVRYNPNVRDRQSTLAALLSHTRPRSQAHMQVLADQRSLLEDVRRQERHATSSINHPIDAQDTEAAADLAYSEASQRSRLESGRALLRDALSYERPGRRLRISQQTNFSDAPAATVVWRPVGAENLEESQTLARMDEANSLPAQYLPTASSTSGDISNRSTLHVPSPPLGTALLTPRFAPAHRLDGEEEAQANAMREELLARLSSRMVELMDTGEHEYIAGHAAQIARMRDLDQDALTPEVREQEAAYLELVETRLELMRRVRDHRMAEPLRLRRMSRSNRAMSRHTPRHHHLQSNLDGLGDRERSFSPEDDQWETMLTTIPPDERFPSAHSSFTSTTASSTSTSSNSTTSLITAPSTSAGAEICPAEYDESEDDSVDVFEAQVAQVEGQANRIEWLSQRLDRQQYQDRHIARRRGLLEREQELQQMLQQIEANPHRAESQVAEEHLVATGRQVGMGGRTARERL